MSSEETLYRVQRLSDNLKFGISDRFKIDDKIFTIKAFCVDYEFPDELMIYATNGKIEMKQNAKDPLNLINDEPTQ